jgi:pyridoxamine 5'-phosphate oxidase
MNREESLKAALELMEQSGDIYVSTIDEENMPQTRVMFNLRNKAIFPAFTEIFKNHDSDLMVYLGTNTSSPKIEQLKKNPAICVCFSKPAEFKSLMISGRVEFITDVEIKKQMWMEGWEMYYPKGYTDPDYTLLKLLPVKGKGWYQGVAYEFKLG